MFPIQIFTEGSLHKQLEASTLPKFYETCDNHSNKKSNYSNEKNFNNTQTNIKKSLYNLYNLN